MPTTNTSNDAHARATSAAASTRACPRRVSGITHSVPSATRCTAGATMTNSTNTAWYSKTNVSACEWSKGYSLALIAERMERRSDGVGDQGARRSVTKHTEEDQPSSILGKSCLPFVRAALSCLCADTLESAGEGVTCRLKAPMNPY